MHRHEYPAAAVPSSPPLASSSSPARPFPSPSRTDGKERRVPSVTPRRFRRFFTPRSLPPRATLGALGAAAINRQLPTPQSPASHLLASDLNADADADPASSDSACPSSPTERLAAMEEDSNKRRWPRRHESSAKRRRGLRQAEPLQEPLLLTGEREETTDPPAEARQSPSERRSATLSEFFKASRKGAQAQVRKSNPYHGPVVNSDVGPDTMVDDYRPQPIRKLRNRGFEARLLDREHGFSARPGGHWLATPACDVRAESASFCSESSDIYHCLPFDQPGTCIPFSLASANRTPRTAIGDEQGFVRLFKPYRVAEGDAKLSSVIKVHDNAIMDMDFSMDDTRLATACGDRSGKIVDTATETIAHELGGGHWDSLRQVAFQPADARGAVLATSDRASRVQIWDLRCSSTPVTGITGPNPSDGLDATLEPTNVTTVNTILKAHVRKYSDIVSSASVTAIKWFPAGREHLLLTASEANACVKLWDTRYIKPRRQNEETPLAETPEPSTHTWRAYGITSMTLNNDASRLFAVCKDSTVYAYSTNHLILGHAPELCDNAYRRRPAGVVGLGPLYGLRHERLTVGSFFVKSAMRPGNGSNLLAVGSSRNCAVLFPTDDRHLRAASSLREHLSPAPVVPWPAINQTAAFPIFRIGTPLVRGHSREVTTVSWTVDGALVTASDDHLVRNWQNSTAQARHLRQVGEFGGERHLAGWADVDADWDRDEC
ncbi:hypothetical protein RJ55_05448 [Drechmeria coniospora]|nr:hypothetical protein RJ55_05448 [Drechmeria coniospora]